RAPRPSLTGLASAEGWPCPLREGENIAGCCVHSAVGRVWQSFKGGWDGALRTKGPKLFEVRRRVVFGAPGDGGLGGGRVPVPNPLHRPLHRDECPLHFVPCCLGGELADVFDTATQTATGHEGGLGIRRRVKDSSWRARGCVLSTMRQRREHRCRG
ncbi:putative retrotransposon hot spot (RHS) protein, partial [Trypanosoma conorhini]